MKKIKEFIKKHDNLFAWLLLIIIFLVAFYFNLANSDEVWNFSTIYQMCNGYEIYRDLNVIMTPLFFYLIKIVFKIFASNFLVFRICNIIINSLLYLVIYNIYKNILKEKTTSLLYTLITYLCYYLTLFCMCNYNSLAILFCMMGILINIRDRKKYDYILEGIIVFLIFMTKQNIGIYFALGLILNFIMNKKMKKQEGIKLLKSLFIAIVLFLIYCSYLYLNNNLYNFINYCFLGINEFTRNIKAEKMDLIIFIFMPIATVFFTIIGRKHINEKIITLECMSIPLLLCAYPIFNRVHIAFSLIGITCAFFLMMETFILKDLVSFKLKKSILYILIILLICYSGFYFINCIKYLSQKDYISDTFYGTIINEKEDKLIGNDIESNIINITNYIKNNKNRTIIISPYSKLYIILLNYNNGIFDLPFLGNLGKEGEKGAIEKLSNLQNTSILIEKNEENLIYQESKKIRQYVQQNYREVGEIEQFIIYEK